MRTWLVRTHHVEVEEPPAERRRHRRRKLEQNGEALRARIIGGAEGRVVDISASGAMLALRQRLSPGHRVLLQWHTPESTHRAMAVVVRSSVGRLLGDEGIEYRVGVSLKEPLALV